MTIMSKMSLISTEFRDLPGVKYYCVDQDYLYNAMRVYLTFNNNYGSYISMDFHNDSNRISHEKVP